MNLLLDTHIALWAIVDSPKLAGQARTLIADPGNSISVSVASLWEIAIKHALQRKGTSRMPVSATTASHHFEAAGFELLAITPNHVRALEALPELHSDPFDRILVAQAMSEPLRLVSHDPMIAAYGDMIIHV